MSDLTTKAAEIRAGLVERLRDDRHCDDWYLRQEAAALIEQQAAELDRERLSHLNTRDSRERWKVSTFTELRRARSAESERDELLREKERLREDAERWRALMSSQRMHMMGSYGFDYVFDPPDSRKHVDLVDVVPRAGDHLHFGIEFWSTHAAFGDPAWPDAFPRKLLLTYVDEMRARSALAEESTQNIGKNLSEDGQHLSPAGERSATNG